MADSSIPLGFKRLTVENWLTVDPAWRDILMPNSDPDPSRAWVKDVLDTQLSPSTPPEIVRLFEAARGTLVYSLMFYPLIAIGLDQLTRVVEAAALAKCRALGAPQGVNGFTRSIEWLAAQRVIPDSDRSWWRSMVALRNEVSHPQDQSQYWPGWVFRQIDATVAAIAALFPSTIGGR